MGKRKFSNVVAIKPNTAKALNTAIGAPVNVKHYGAKGDGVTDDATAIQNAINAVATAGGGVVFMPLGTYVCAATIVMKTNVKLQGEGDVSIIKATAVLNGTTGIIQNESAASRFEICDLTIDGNASGMAAGEAGDGIRLASCSYASIRRVNFINVGQSKISMRACIYISDTCVDTFVDEPRGISVQATPTLWYGVYDGGATRTVLQNAYFYGFGDEPVVFVNSRDFTWQGGRVCYGADNTAGNGSHGCHITATAGTCRGTVIGVEADNNYDDGFRIDTGAGGDTDITIISCNAHHNGNIGISCAGRAHIIGNRCYANEGGSSNSGIVIIAPNCVVIGNYCYNNGMTGIYALSGTTDLIVQGNISTNKASTAQNYGIIVAAGVTEVVMIGNNFAGNVTAPIQLDGSAISLFDWLGSATNISGLPTSDPAVAGRPWLNAGVLTVSAGA